MWLTPLHTPPPSPEHKRAGIDLGSRADAALYAGDATPPASPPPDGSEASHGYDGEQASYENDWEEESEDESVRFTLPAWHQSFYATRPVWRRPAYHLPHVVEALSPTPHALPVTPSVAIPEVQIFVSPSIEDEQSQPARTEVAAHKPTRTSFLSSASHLGVAALDSIKRNRKHSDTSISSTSSVLPLLRHLPFASSPSVTSLLGSPDDTMEELVELAEPLGDFTPPFDSSAELVPFPTLPKLHAFSPSNFRNDALWYERQLRKATTVEAQSPLILAPPPPSLPSVSFAWQPKIYQADGSYVCKLLESTKEQNFEELQQHLKLLFPNEPRPTSAIEIHERLLQLDTVAADCHKTAMALALSMGDKDWARVGMRVDEEN